MPAMIKNPSTEPCSLPYPFRGVLAGGQAIVLNLTVARATEVLGEASPLLVSEVPGDAFDAFYMGFLDDEGQIDVAGNLEVVGGITSQNQLSVSNPDTGDSITVDQESIYGTEVVIEVLRADFAEDITVGTGAEIGGTMACIGASVGAQELANSGPVSLSGGSILRITGVGGESYGLPEAPPAGALLLVLNDSAGTATFDDPGTTVLAAAERAIFVEAGGSWRFFGRMA